MSQKYQIARAEIFAAILPVVGMVILLMLLNACRQSIPDTREIKVQSPGTTLYTRITGELPNKRVLIAVHGGPGNSSDYMVSLEQLASKDLTVVLYDQRGTGQSGEPTDGYALDRSVEDLEAVRVSTNAEKIDLLGHSWGGVVALRYATVHPERIDSIILLGSGPPNLDAIAAAQANLRARIISLQELGLIPQEFPSQREDLIHTILPAYFSNPNFEMPIELANMSFNQEASDQTYADTGEWNFTYHLNELEHRVLFLWGEMDPFGIEMAQTTITELDSADVRFVLLNNCGHYWHECPEAFFDAVRVFLVE